MRQYISTIKALHQLDPSGTTLAAISKPIQAYLRGRPVEYPLPLPVRIWP